MPSYILKTTPDEDFYVMWSTIVDAPTAWGTRTEFETCRWLTPQDVAAERFDRADEFGTSCAAIDFGPGVYRFYDWTADGMIYQQRGILPRSRLRELCARLEKDEQADVSDLLESLEDDE